MLYFKLYILMGLLTVLIVSGWIRSTGDKPFETMTMRDWWVIPVTIFFWFIPLAYVIWEVLFEDKWEAFKDKKYFNRFWDELIKERKM